MELIGATAPSAGADGCRGGLDQLGHLGRVGDHRDVAALQLDGGRTHPAGELPLGEAYLWGRVVDALTARSVVYWMICAWAALGLFGILAGVTVAGAADRLAHRRRLIAMSTAFEQAITLPLSYHARKGTGTRRG